jgi:hypothetical protein
MKSAALRRLSFGAVILLAVAVGSTAWGKDDQPAKTAVEGLVRDISCAIQNKAATATNLNLTCALECARNGSPLIILSKDGVLYVPISSSMPDKDQRQRLMPFVGKYVKVTGTVYERSGTHAIAIDQIVEMKDVHVVTDAH